MWVALALATITNGAFTGCGPDQSSSQTVRAGRLQHRQWHMCFVALHSERRSALHCRKLLQGPGPSASVAGCCLPDVLTCCGWRRLAAAVALLPFLTRHCPAALVLQQGTGRSGPPMYLSVRSFARDAAHNRLLAVPAVLYAVNNYLKFGMQLYFKPTTAKMLSNMKVGAPHAGRIKALGGSCAKQRCA
jgi:hypothetical protein